MKWKFVLTTIALAACAQNPISCVVKEGRDPIPCVRIRPGSILCEPGTNKPGTADQTLCYDHEGRLITRDGQQVP